MFFASFLISLFNTSIIKHGFYISQIMIKLIFRIKVISMEWLIVNLVWVTSKLSVFIMI